MNSFRFLQLMLMVLAACVVLIEARGGRGRGGGSFGGLFGGWRKYKKPSSGGSSRRIMNGSPMHTSLTKPQSPSLSSSLSSSSSSIRHSVKPNKIVPTYPKQPMNGYGYGSAASYYSPGGAGAARLPPGSTFYNTAASIPQGSIYYTHPPRSSGNSDFFLGLMTGHVMNNLFFSRPHISHEYHQHTPSSQGQGSRIIIINNGEGMSSTESPEPNNENKTQNWPYDVNVSLAPFDTTPSSDKESTTVEPTQAPIFEQPQTPPTPEHGIICMPMTLNETDPNNPSRVIGVARIVCFPAPPPPPVPITTPSPEDKTNCGKTLVSDDNPLNLLEGWKEPCSEETSTPEKIFGEIADEY